MSEFCELFKTADWKAEKHAPVIEVPEKIVPGEIFHVTASIGKEIPHPNQPEHFISWMDVFFHPEGEKFPVNIGKFEFNGHGTPSEVFTHPFVTFAMKTTKPGKLFATSYCNIHGLWRGEVDIKF